MIYGIYGGVMNLEHPCGWHQKRCS